MTPYERKEKAKELRHRAIEELMSDFFPPVSDVVIEQLFQSIKSRLTDIMFQRASGEWVNDQ